MFTRSFTVETLPIAKGRPKFRRIGKFVSTYTPKKTKDYETLVAEAATKCMDGHEPLETPLRLNVTFNMPIPKSYSKKHKDACLEGLDKPINKPDIDNLCKSLFDGMNGIVFKDDGQIVTLIVSKKYWTEGLITVTVSEDIA
jgi:Holliday junction resolvase RusA-like endonuclease